MTGNLLIAVLLAQPTSAPNVPGSRPTTVPATEVFSWAKGTFLGNNLWQWLGLLGVLLVSMVVGKLISYFLQRQADRFEAAERRKVLGMVLRGLAGPTRLWALAVGLYAADLFMTFAEKIADFWWRVCAAIAVLAGAWLIYRLVEVVEHLLLRWTARTKTRLDDQLVPMVRKTLRVFVLIVAALVIAQNIFEMQIGAMLAGLGIGGLAFALAARDTVANFFGSLTIFVDRPFQLGHRIKLAGYDGFVEEVGFRSTRVRTLDGHLVSIPNAKIASDAVENISRRPSIRRVLDVTVTYDTPPEKVQRGVEILREMLEAGVLLRLQRREPQHRRLLLVHAAGLVGIPGLQPRLQHGTPATVQRRGHRVRLPHPDAVPQAGLADRGRRQRHVVGAKLIAPPPAGAVTDPRDPRQAPSRPRRPGRRGILLVRLHRLQPDGRLLPAAQPLQEQAHGEQRAADDRQDRAKVAPGPHQLPGDLAQVASGEEPAGHHVDGDADHDRKDAEPRPDDLKRAHRRPPAQQRDNAGHEDEHPNGQEPQPVKVVDQHRFLSQDSVRLERCQLTRYRRPRPAAGGAPAGCRPGPGTRDDTPEPPPSPAPRR